MALYSPGVDDVVGCQLTAPPQQHPVCASGMEFPREFRGLRGLLVGWLLNVPATCECISGTDLLRQFYVLPH